MSRHLPGWHGVPGDPFSCLWTPHSEQQLSQATHWQMAPGLPFKARAARGPLPRATTLPAGPVTGCTGRGINTCAVAPQAHILQALRLQHISGEPH